MHSRFDNCLVFARALSSRHSEELNILQVRQIHNNEWAHRKFLKPLDGKPDNVLFFFCRELPMRAPLFQFTNETHHTDAQTIIATNMGIVRLAFVFEWLGVCVMIGGLPLKSSAVKMLIECRDK